MKVYLLVTSYPDLPSYIHGIFSTYKKSEKAREEVNEYDEPYTYTKELEINRIINREEL